MITFSKVPPITNPLGTLSIELLEGETETIGEHNDLGNWESDILVLENSEVDVCVRRSPLSMWEAYMGVVGNDEKNQNKKKEIEGRRNG